MDPKRLEPVIAQLSRVLPQRPMRTSEALRAAQIDDRCAGEEAISELVRAGRVRIWADSTLRWIADQPGLPAVPDLPVGEEQGLAAEESTRRIMLQIVEERDAFRAMVEELLKSAVPHPIEHPTMTRAWARARALLQKYA